MPPISGRSWRSSRLWEYSKSEHPWQELASFRLAPHDDLHCGTLGEVDVMHGRYETLVRKALEKVGRGPWNTHDIDRVRDTLTQDFCLAFDPHCDKHAVLDWLGSLSPTEMTELIDHLNRDQDAGGPEMPHVHRRVHE